MHPVGGEEEGMGDEEKKMEEVENGMVSSRYFSRSFFDHFLNLVTHTLVQL